MNTAELQQAIYNRLNSVTAVTNAVVGIYTDVVQPAEPEDNSAFPYLTIGPIIASPYDDKDDNGGTVLVDVHLWSRSRSAKARRAVMDDVYTALQRYDSLSVTGSSVVDCRFDSEAEFQDPDERTWHSVRTFRVVYFIA